MSESGNAIDLITDDDMTMMASFVAVNAQYDEEKEEENQDE